MRRLAEAGLTTREACGNSVRNITACQFAGVAADEPFDVTPYAEALTRFLLRHPLQLVAAAQVQDRVRGLHARSHQADDQRHRLAGAVQDGRRGFRVYVGGGTATMTTAAHGALRVPPGRGHAERGRGRDPRVPRARRLPAPAAQPDEVPDQGDGLGRLPGRLRRGAGPGPGRGRPRPGVRRWSRPPIEPAPCLAARQRRRTSTRSSAAWTPRRCAGPASSRSGGRRRSRGGSATTAGRAPTCGRRSRRTSRSAVVTVPLGDLSGEQYPHPRRSGQRLRRRHGARHRGAGPGVPLGPPRRPAGAVRPARSGRTRPARRRHDRRRHQLSRRRVVQAGGDAVARARPGARAAPARHAGADRPGARARHQDQRLSQRLRPASHRDHRLPGQPAQGRRQGRAAVLHPGRRRHRRRAARRFGRLAAKVPARRAPEALERLVRLYAADTPGRRDAGGVLPASSRCRRSRRCSPISRRSRARPPTETDFIDLAETTAFRPETTEGECAV